jgi:hypothetical protein
MFQPPLSRKNTTIYWLEHWVGHATGLEAVEKRKACSLEGESKPDPSVV